MSTVKSVVKVTTFEDSSGDEATTKPAPLVQPKLSGPSGITSATKPTPKKTKSSAKKNKMDIDTEPEPHGEKRKRNKSGDNSVKKFINDAAEEAGEDEDDSDYEDEDSEEEEAAVPNGHKKKRKSKTQDSSAGALMDEGYTFVKQLEGVEPDGLTDTLRAEYYQFNKASDENENDFTLSPELTKKIFKPAFSGPAAAWGLKYYAAYKAKDVVQGEDIKSEDEESEEEDDENDKKSMEKWVAEGDEIAAKEAIIMGNGVKDPTLPNLGDDSDDETLEGHTDGLLRLHSTYPKFESKDSIETTVYSKIDPKRTFAAQGVNFPASKEEKEKKKKKAITESADGKVKAVLSEPEKEQEKPKEKEEAKPKEKEKEKKEKEKKKDKSESKKERKEKKEKKEKSKKEKSSEPEKKKRKKSSSEESAPKESASKKTASATNDSNCDVVALGLAAVTASMESAKEDIAKQLNFSKEDYDTHCNNLVDYFKTKSVTEVDLRSKNKDLTFLSDDAVESALDLIYTFNTLVQSCPDYKSTEFFKRYANPQRRKGVAKASLDFMVSGGGQLFGFKTKHDIKPAKSAPKKAKNPDLDFD